MNLDPDQVKKNSDIARVIGGYLKLERNGHDGEFIGKCPFHKDDTPSFSVTCTPSKQVYYCFGCEATGDVFKFIQRIDGVDFPEALKRVAEVSGINTSKLVQRNGHSAPVREELPIKPKVTAVYPYFDEHRKLAYEVLRIEPGRRGQKKDFTQRRKHPVDKSWVTGLKSGFYRKSSETGEWHSVKDNNQPEDYELPECQRILFHLPDVMESQEVWIVEGEKDALTAERLGYCGTTSSGGAKQPWLSNYSECLRRKSAVVIPDNDEPGHKKAALIAESLKTVCTEVTLLVLPGTVKDLTEWVETGGTREQLDEMLESAKREKKRAEIESRGLLTLPEVIELYEGGLNAFLDPSKRKPGIKTGFVFFDGLTNGLHGGEVLVIAARPAMGKTAIALNIAIHVAKQENPVAIFSLEMSRESLFNRAICSHGYIDSQRFRGGFLNKDERRRLTKSYTEVSAMPLLIDDKPNIDLDAIRKRLTTMKKERGLKLVLLDYLQLMSFKGAENRNLEVAALSRNLKIMARELDAPFIILSQLSRATEIRSGSHRPQLSDLKDSGGIEQDADMVAFVFREEVYKPDNQELKGCAELILAKQRNGPIGTTHLTFLGNFTRFENRAEDVDESASAQPHFEGGW